MVRDAGQDCDLTDERVIVEDVVLSETIWIRLLSSRKLIKSSYCWGKLQPCLTWGT